MRKLLISQCASRVTRGTMNVNPWRKKAALHHFEAIYRKDIGSDFERSDEFRLALQRSYGSSQTWSKWMDGLQAINSAIIAAAFIGLSLSSDVIGRQGSDNDKTSTNLLRAQLFSGAVAFLLAFFGILSSTAASRIIASITYVLGSDESAAAKGEGFLDLESAAEYQTIADAASVPNPSKKAKIDYYNAKRKIIALKKSRNWVQGLRQAAQVFTGMAFIALSTTVVLIINQRLTPWNVLSIIIDVCFILGVVLGTWMVYIPNMVVVGGRRCGLNCCHHPYSGYCCCGPRFCCKPIPYDAETDDDLVQWALP
jgi:uncharacterized membrane protein YqjE